MISSHQNFTENLASLTSSATQAWNNETSKWFELQNP